MVPSTIFILIISRTNQLTPSAAGLVTESEQKHGSKNIHMSQSHAETKVENNLTTRQPLRQQFACSCTNAPKSESLN
jgi:hypothetical protein